jgi:hypothetical protein
MLVPRFTIRTLLVVLTICAFISVVIGMAYRGQHWARGVTIGMASLALTALVHAAWFGVVWMLARFQSRHQEKPSRGLE